MVNSLPEVHEMLAREFDGEPISKQNLDKWKKNGFRNWKFFQAALDFAEDSLPDGLDEVTLGKMTSKLVHCLQIRYAAVAGSLPLLQDNPDTELRRLGQLCNNVTAVRRGDVAAGRLSVELQRLNLEKSRAQTEKEKEFWEWTKRPDIQEKLHPHRDPDKTRREVERMINRQLLGIDKPAVNHDETADPAVLI